MSKAIGLFSGGLDSILSFKVLQEQGIALEAVTFVTPFFDSRSAEKAACHISAPLHIVDITESHFEMLKNPRYGYGRNMNPCIDCHALMFNRAGHFMREREADFLFSGEVLGERRMSQNKNSLVIVARLSGFEEVIVRPLSARLLPITQPERTGLVDRNKLLAIEGRSRKPQIALAEKYGITDYPEPAGGCKLTNPDFSHRLSDLLHARGPVSRRDLDLLSVGRHFRIAHDCKTIVGRDEQDNAAILYLSEQEDTVLFPQDISGPVVLLRGHVEGTAISRAASLCLRYAKAPGRTPVTVYRNNNASTHYAEPCSESYAAGCLIQRGCRLNTAG